MPLVELLSMPQVPNDLIICALSYNSPYKPPHNKRILDVKKRKAPRRRELHDRVDLALEVEAAGQHLREVPYYTASHTTLHTTLRLNKNGGALRQRKLRPRASTSVQTTTQPPPPAPAAGPNLGVDGEVKSHQVLLFISTC